MLPLKYFAVDILEIPDVPCTEYHLVIFGKDPNGYEVVLSIAQADSREQLLWLYHFLTAIQKLIHQNPGE